ncbi:MAG: type II secretion system protein [Lentisphaeria bacterium]|nr:type II secretion system protein [Lentisphaeria bacterium]
MQSRALRALSFTLIELLVVIALVSIMLSFLMSAMNESRIKSRLTDCQGKLRFLAQALATYQQDNKGFTVVGWDSNVQGTDNSQRIFWAKLKPYYGDEENRLCPANPLDEKYCYGLYGAIAGRDMATYIPNPAGTVYIGENTQLAYESSSRHIDTWERSGAGDWELGYAVNFTSDTPTYQWSLRRPFNPFVHRPLVNLAFCDGRVEAIHYHKAWGGPYHHGDPANIWDNQ